MSTEICCIKGCDLIVLAAGLCSKHWRRNKKYGSPMLVKGTAAGMIGKSAIERFNLQHVKSSDCWHWSASKDKDGYGIFKGEARGVLYKRAHRFSYAYFKGEIPAHISVCHTCDNPSCCNPDHLWLGTVLQNQRDKWDKGKYQAPKGEKAPRAKLSEDDVRWIIDDERDQITLASKFGVTQQTISDIKRGRSWSHLKRI